MMMMKMIAKRSAAKMMLFFIVFIINSIIDNGYWREVHVVYIIVFGLADVVWLSGINYKLLVLPDVVVIRFSKTVRRLGV